MLFHSSMCSSHSRGSYKLCLTSTSMGYFISPPFLPLSLFTWQSEIQESQHCPRNFDTFQARPESELPGKQTNKKSIFSIAHFIRFPSSSPHTLLASALPVLFTHVPNIPTSPQLSPVNQCIAITCLGHILRDTT